MCFSSGTSGKPKGVILSHHNLIAQLVIVRATNPSTYNFRIREPFFPSFAHIYGIVSGVLAPACIGNYVQPMKKFEYLPYLLRAAELKGNTLRLVPAAAVRMTKDPDIQGLDLSSKELIKYKGNQIAPADLEAVLLSHPAVVDAGVCGVGGKMAEGELPVAFVCLGETISETDRGKTMTDIMAYVHERVSSYKRLRGGRFSVDSLPKHNSGKLLRRQLVLMAARLKGSRSKI
ncbi:hypothetical protein ACHAQH_005784 [Verticillium albo-atrum]